MSAAVLPRLNPIAYTGIERILAGKRVTQRGLKSFIPGGRRSLFSYSGFSHFSPYTSSLASDNSHCRPRSPSPGRRQTMAASGSMPVFGDIYFDDLATNCANSLYLAKPSVVYFADRARASCQGASMSLKKTEQANSRLVCRSFMIDAIQRNSSGVVHVGPLLRNVHTSSTTCLSLGQAHDLSFDNGSQDEELTSSPVSSLKNLKLLSGSCYLPHPAKEETGGEDAHFICDEEQVIGVADGVGGWAEVGVNAGLFARELMSNSVAAIQELPKGSVNPLTVLERAHSGTKARGSSTACIIVLTDQGLHAINLGDSGFIVVRDGSTIFRSPVQQHGFNFTYQLESGDGGDMPSSGQVFTIPVETGDVIVTATDGVFDNLYNNEISGAVVSSVRALLDPKSTAQKIAALARERAMDRERETPFSAAALEAGFRFHGGKLDDITVVVSYITSSSEA